MKNLQENLTEDDIIDPFLITGLENEVSAIKYAFNKDKPERAIMIMDITKCKNDVIIYYCVMHI